MPQNTRDNEVMTAIIASLKERGRLPTTKELCGDIKMTRGQLYRNLERLTIEGRLKRRPVGTIHFEPVR